MVEFKLPDVGEGMHEGEILKILVRPGDTVSQDQPVIEVQTDKVNAELSAPVSGVIQEIRVAEGETVEVGSTLLVIRTGEAAASVPAASTQETSIQKAAEKRPAVPQMSQTNQNRRSLATPYVRQLAREMKIDIERVIGTGPIGRVTEEDLRQFQQGSVKPSTPDISLVPAKTEPKSSSVRKAEEQLAATAFATPETSSQMRVERLPLKGIRKKIAEHMVKSVTIIPHVTSVDEIEMDQLRELRERLLPHANKREIKLTFLPFFVKALVIALKEFPTFNASIDDETNEVLLKHFYHIGIATDTPDGLIVPVIKDADRKSILQIAREISELAQRARDGKLSLDQITGGTFTISNVGPIGGLQATPIINHPEVAIMALHKMEKRWVVREDEGVIRWMMNLSLSFDHRLIDGVTAVRFTNRIKELLEDPNLLFLEMV
ncbi:dihydrolipoamide acetyltransferase family protein [Brevibacillus nitrificans]|uniref:dihydrolipoamide acetyltransferase family protein n=1 Tax=Brevibacillus nitrificans TaxID=651560 RepID=UPI002E20452E|nr:dihydrolipoamide acetyltransferase family protein [Brevibacillus nitrificans]